MYLNIIIDHYIHIVSDGKHTITLHIINHISKETSRAVLSYLKRVWEYEKMFDSVGWDFLFKCMEIFGDTFKECKRTLYSFPPFPQIK